MYRCIMKKLLVILFVVLNVSVQAQINDDQIHENIISDNLQFQKDINSMKEKHDGDGYLESLFNMLTEYNNTQDLLFRLDIAKNELYFLPDFVNPKSYVLLKVYKRMAFLYYLIYDNDNALSYIEKAIDVISCNEAPNQKEMADALSLKCKYQQILGQFYSAISTGESAIELYCSLHVDPVDYVDLLSDLSMAYSSVLQHEKALDVQRQAISIYENNNDWLSLAESLNLAAHYCQSMEKLDEAEQYSQKAIHCLYDHDNANQYIKDTALLGDTSIITPQSIEAVKDRIAIDKGNCLQTLARIYFKKGNLNEAILLEKENGNLIKARNDDEMYSVHLLTLSQYYQENHQYTESISCCEQCIDIVKETNNQLLGLARQQMAIIYTEMEKQEQAMRFAEESASILNSPNYKIEKIIGSTSLAYFYYKYGKYDDAENILATALGTIQDTIKQVMCSMTPEQKQRFWNKYDYNFLMYRNIIWKSNKKDEYIGRLYDFTLFYKNLLLDTGYRREHDDLSRFEVTWQEIQKKLTNQDIAIEFISVSEDDREHYTYLAMVIDNVCRNPKLITLYSESDLIELRQKDSRSVNDIVGELIWKPILNQYSKVKNIYFSADGVFHILPIEYFNFDSTRNLFDHYNVYRLSSTKELVALRDAHMFNSVVLYGGLEYNADYEDTSELMEKIAKRSGFEPLHNTLIEVQEIGSLLSEKNIATKLYLGENGTEDSFRKLSGQDISGLHMATHGMYISISDVAKKGHEKMFTFIEFPSNENDPVKEDMSLTHSFLVLAGGNHLSQREAISGINDGILTAKEISQLDLKGLDLVVLSACQTALGDVDNEGVFGLQRGFKKAGAKTILMSLDKVDDEATKILMVEFYKNLMSGKTKRQSLKNAQKYLRQIYNGKYDDPKYWASFIMLDGLN